jgi:hypothetical protein
MKLHIPRGQLVVNKHDLTKHIALSKEYIKTNGQYHHMEDKKESQKKVTKCVAQEPKKEES